MAKKKKRKAKNKTAKKSTPKVDVPQAPPEPKATPAMDPAVAKLLAKDQMKKADAAAKASRTKTASVKKDPADVIRKPDGSIKRNEDMLREDYASSLEKTDPADLTPEEKVALEREIRRLVTRGERMDHGVLKQLKGGPHWRKGLTEAEIARGKLLLTRIGRDPEKPEWDVSIIVPGMDTPEVR